MSRIGRMPITVPAGVDVTIDESNLVTVKGKLGQLQTACRPEMKVTLKDGVITVERPNDEKLMKSLHGLTRALINNMIVGVTEGYSKTLEINGVGYRAALQGKKLVLGLGYSHDVIFEEEDGITYEVPNPNTVVVKGIDKQRVGELAANIRGKRPPEPYLGKGIRYQGEHVRRKAGKAGK